MSTTMRTICPACSSPMNSPEEVTCLALCEEQGRRVNFHHCPSCKLTIAPDNTYDFSTEGDFQQDNRPSKNRGRVGTDEWPGREYSMACLGINTLKLAGLPCESILIFGAGLSNDHRRLAENFSGLMVKITDLDNFQNANNFVPYDSKEKFDIVVACEVVEHFLDIPKDFNLLLSKITHSGIAIISTNVSDGKNIQDMQYPFFPGHTAYYSGKSLISIAKNYNQGMHVDFRVPLASLAQLGPRKRYALMYHDDSLQIGIAEYFATYQMAPSEKPNKPHILGRTLRLARRLAQRASRIYYKSK